MADLETLRALITNPIERIQTELKSWIDPKTDHGKAKIARALLALRNANGGFLLMGFDDTMRTPDTHDMPSDVRLTFHPDVIQGIVSDYASETFEIEVHLVPLGKLEYPVIEVPVGVRTPVVCKADLINPNPSVKQKYLLRDNTIYVRSLASNGTVGSSPLHRRDLENLMRICVENREADIGVFLRRNLSGGQLATLRDLIVGTPLPDTQDAAVKHLEHGHWRFTTRVYNELKLELPTFGTWEVSLTVLPKLPHTVPDRQFLDVISASNPTLTGWPVWLDSRGFTDKQSEPYVFDNAWEALIVSLTGWGGKHIEFMRLEPQGRFYLLRALEDDVDISRGIQPMTLLEPRLAILRVAEALAVGQSMARALGADNESQLSFAFRWKGLQGRTLRAWAASGLEDWSFGSGSSRQNTITSHVTMQLDEPQSRIADRTLEAVRPLMALFDGYMVRPAQVTALVSRLLERRL